MRHVINALVQNKPGVLARIVGLFSARGFNIESLVVGETEDPDVSRMTVTVGGDDKILEQVRKQLSKLIDVIKVNDLQDDPYVERDLMLIKVHAPAPKRPEIVDLANIFRAKVVDVSEKSMALEITGTEEKINAFIRMVRPYGVKELARTGRLAMVRGG
jgi:acetolactate synthase I/III small subunit